MGRLGGSFIRRTTLTKVMERFTKIISLAFVALVVLDSFGVTEGNGSTSSPPSSPVTTTTKLPTTTTQSKPSTTTQSKPSTTTQSKPSTAATAASSSTASHTSGHTSTAATATSHSGTTITAHQTTTGPHGGTPSLVQAWSQLVAIATALILLAA